jgi:GxxExxY protein
MSAAIAESRLQAKQAREAAKAAKAVEKEAKAVARAVAKAAKAALKAAKGSAKVLALPRVVAELSDAPAPPDMPAYGKLDVLRGFADEVCASLGAGHSESIYHAAMAVELRLAGIMYESEQVMPITHKGSYVGIVRADIIVAKECVLEFKISGKLEDAKQQARQYMKLQRIPHGFVVMFPKIDGGKVQFVDARLPDDGE